jgi:predicted dehydrogenase
MEGDLPVVYEANCISAGDLTSWYGDIRAEGEEGTLTMVYPRLYIARRGADQLHVAGLRQDLAVVADSHAGQADAFAEFLASIGEDRPAETSAEDNLRTMALLFAAVDACRTGRSITTADYLII